MSESLGLDDFTNLVLRNLEKNGFPEKAVSFPLEKMYETASQKGFSFNKVREALKLKDIESEISGERVIFSRKAPAADMFDMSKMAEAAQQMFQNMSAEQQAQITQMIQSMNPEEIAKIKNQWAEMPDEDKAQAIHAAQKNHNPGP